jgi:hypothetical protein
MLIALARVAIDHPKEVLKHKAFLKRVALGKEGTHILQRHFAALALVHCSDAQPREFSTAEITKLKNVSASAFPPVRATKPWGNSYYQPRPATLPEPPDDFHLDYDFDKYEVATVGDAFGKTHWEVGDGITRWVRGFDPTVTGMYDHGGRDEGRSERFMGMNSEHHGYGQYLGWHGLYEVAGNFLKNFPTVIYEYDGERWLSWFSDQTLSCSGGLWLSDGLDRPPIEIQSNLIETDSSGVNLTSNKQKVLSLLGIKNTVVDGLVVCGNWQSADNIDVKISSALLPVGESETVANRLATMEPFQVSLPFFDDEAPNRSTGRDEQKGVEWILQPSVTTKIDQTDPWGSVSALRRPQFSKEIQSRFSLRPADLFNRDWIDEKNNKVATAEAWGGHSHLEHDNKINGARLLCTRGILSKVLQAENSDLLLLVILRRYDKGYSGDRGKYWHTTAVVRVRQSLTFNYFPGALNKFRKDKY